MARIARDTARLCRQNGQARALWHGKGLDVGMFSWLFTKKQSPLEAFAKAIPQALDLENARVSCDSSADTASVQGDASSRGWTFSAPTQVRVTCTTTRPLAICLAHQDNLALTFSLEATALPTAPVFDLALSPRAEAAVLAQGGVLHLGMGVACDVQDLDAVLRLSGDLLQTYFPPLQDGRIRALRVGAAETELIYGPALAEGLVHDDLCDDAKLLMEFLEFRRKIAAGERQLRAEDSGQGFAQKLAIVAPGGSANAGLDAANPKQRAVLFQVAGIAARAILRGKNAEPLLQLELTTGDRPGAFKIHHNLQVREDKTAKAPAWSESEKRVFLAKNAFVSSAQTSAEVEFLLGLPQRDREALVGLCTQFDCEIAFAKGVLTVDFRELAQFFFYAGKGRSIDAAEELVAIAANLARIAQAFPGPAPQSADLAMEVCEARGILSTPEAQAPVTTAGAKVESRVYSPLSVARACARRMPGATVEDLGGTGKEGIWARVSYDHDGWAMRLVFYRFDAFTCAVWLETRAAGKLGEFGVMKFDPSEEAEDVAAVGGDEDGDDDERDEDDGDDDEGDDDGDGREEAAAGPSVRIFVGKDTYIDGPHAAAEAAQVLALPENVQSALTALVTEVGTVVLKQEVLSLNLGELSAFAEAKERHRGPLAYPLALGARLGALAAALPPAR